MRTPFQPVSAGQFSTSLWSRRYSWRQSFILGHKFMYTTIECQLKYFLDLQLLCTVMFSLKLFAAEAAPHAPGRCPPSDAYREPLWRSLLALGHLLIPKIISGLSLRGSHRLLDLVQGRITCFLDPVLLILPPASGILCRWLWCKVWGKGRLCLWCMSESGPQFIGSATPAFPSLSLDLLSAPIYIKSAAEILVSSQTKSFFTLLRVKCEIQ